jgi:hypothetical protein
MFPVEFDIHTREPILPLPSKCSDGKQITAVPGRPVWLTIPSNLLRISGWTFALRPTLERAEPGVPGE